MQIIKKRKYLFIIATLLAALLVVSISYQFGYFPQKQSGTSPQQTVASSQQKTGSVENPIISSSPAIFATLTFSNQTGFKNTIHPTNETTEFILSPNSVGEVSVTYTGFGSNDLTTSFFSVINPVSVLKLSSNGTLVSSSELSVTQSSVTTVSTHQVIVTYTMTSGASDGLYVLDLPSTFLSTFVNVGTQPYTGPLTWLNGTFS
jgi:hypothetical protein